MIYYTITAESLKGKPYSTQDWNCITFAADFVKWLKPLIYYDPSVLTSLGVEN